MDLTFLIAAVAFLAASIQSLTGFGSALVAMGLLPALIGLASAAPLVALLTGTIETALLLRYRQSIRWGAIGRLIVGLLVGSPIGIWGLRLAPERPALAALGILISAYCLYGLLTPKLPRLVHPGWAYPFGFLAGVLGGAYNTSGPPAVLYADTQRWGPTEFRANLQGLFLVSDAAVIVGHALAGNLTSSVWRAYGICLIPLLAGILLGGALGGRLGPAAFRKITLAFLFLVGLRLVLG